MRLSGRAWLLSAVLLSVCGSILTIADAAAHDRDSAADGAVYVMTNRASANSVIAFARSSDGRLRRRQEVRTGGRGSGATMVDPLTSQNSLVQSGNGHFLLAVNAGSNSISVLAVRQSGLRLVSLTSSGGVFPNSIGVHGDLVYVLNAHGTPNVTAFRLDPFGSLHAITNSRRALPGGAASAPTDVRFSHDGMRVVVSESGTNRLDVFELGNDGRTTSVTTHASAGVGPFGFTFARDSVVLSTEAMSGSVSSYHLNHDNTLTVLSPAVANGQMATCWIALTRNGRYAYVSNTMSATLSSYGVATDGTLTLLQATAATTGEGSAPIDSALSRDSRFLYVIDSAQGRVLSFRANAASLSPLGRIAGLPKSIQGIVAR